MNYVLGIDTSSIELGMGLASVTNPVMAVSRYLRNSHAEHISQAIEYLLSANCVKASEISHAAIAVGPGSFTGLRIGIAFLKGFFFGKQAHVYPVSSLESLAGSWNARNRTIACAFDARNGEVFWARFEKCETGLNRISEDILSPIHEFERSIEDNDVVLTDTLGYARSTAFTFLKDRPEVYGVEHFPVQRGLACATIAASHVDKADLWIKVEALEPRYLNTVFAEKNRTVAAA
jgi:tRNA threonylcarbamoyl adenosine modification protein YeaZ